jgi:hypothetical protein
MKNHLLFNLILGIFTYHNVFAEVLHWPQLCEGGELQIQNNSPHAFSVWLQKFDKNLVQEIEIELADKSTIIYPLENITKDEHYSLLHFAEKLAVEVVYKCNNKTYAANSFEGGVITFQKSDNKENLVVVENLYSGKNSVQIHLKDKYFNIIQTKDLELASFKKYYFDIPKDLTAWTSVQINATHKYSVFYLDQQTNPKPLTVKPQPSEIDTKANYFLVGPRSGAGDSFIVKITDTSIIEKARDLIKNPQKEKMLFAKIQKDHMGFNRNWSKPEKSFWSWSASEVTSFGELGSTACNGTPQQVEDRVDFWVEDPGQICFWNYRVKKELKTSEVAHGL